MTEVKRTNILMVDDHPENLIALEAVLEGLDQNLVMVHSAKEALKCLLEETFALILMDVQMPEMDGFEAASLIRASARTRSTPIVFISAVNKSDLHQAKGYSLGAVDYVVKPFDPDTLRAKVSAFVDMAKNTNALQEEILRRQKAEATVGQLNDNLRKLNQDLEKRIEERTAHVEALNERLKQTMTETHHRVKNNLQLLAALVDLQVMEDTDSIPVEEMKRFGAHIRSLAVIHDLLTQQSDDDGDTTWLPAGTLFHRVLDLLGQVQGARRMHFHAEETRLSVRQATSLALIMNELISNASKHGQGDIEVDFVVTGPHATLTVCDAGPGFPPAFDAMQASHTGLQMVENLVRHDLSGEVNYENRTGGGAQVCVLMPLPVDALTE